MASIENTPPQRPSVLLAMPCPLPLEASKLVSYVGDISSPADLIISDLITKEDSVAFMLTEPSTIINVLDP